MREVESTGYLAPVGSHPRPEWVVLLELTHQRWGGDLRRSQIFRRLGERTSGAILNGFSVGPLREMLGVSRYFPVPLFRRGPKPKLASGEMLRPRVLWAMKWLAQPVAVAVYDDPVMQTAALGIALPASRERQLRRRRDANLDAFRWYVVPTASFAELVGLKTDRVIVGGNGTDTNHIQVGEWPSSPAIGMISGAAPARGIELLVEATRRLRPQIPELRLLLWLVATGEESEHYLSDLRQQLRRERWIEIDSIDYQDLDLALHRATALCVPQPPNDYTEVALPVKLFDSMAAGRPLIVTPRAEAARLVTRHGAGIVATGDSVDDLGQALADVLADEAAAQRMGAAARRAAEQHYDWNVVGDRIASEVLSREGELDA
jgi:glycosyltransferase involved in cell wall biosynthesis